MVNIIMGNGNRLCDENEYMGKGWKKCVQLRDNVSAEMYIFLILCRTFPLKDW